MPVAWARVPSSWLLVSLLTPFSTSMFWKYRWKKTALLPIGAARMLPATTAGVPAAA